MQTQEAGLLIALDLTTWQFDQNIPLELARNLTITLVRVSFVSQSVKILAKFLPFCQIPAGIELITSLNISRKQCKVLVEVLAYSYIPINLSKTKRGTKSLKKRDFWSKIGTFLRIL